MKRGRGSGSGEAGLAGVTAIIRGLGLLVLPLYVACCRPAGEVTAPAGANAGPHKPTVFVSIVPQAYFVQRVAGDHVQVEVLVQPGQSAETYEPTPKQVAALSEANVFFRIGLPFEKRLIHKAAAAFDELRVVDTREGITLRRMEEHHHEDMGEPARDIDQPADHVGESTHAVGEPDPHIWLDPRLVKTQAQTICRELCRLDPAHAADYERNLAAFWADLDEVHARIAEVLAPLRGGEFFVFHPAYGYFADAYGLKQVAVQIGGKEPSQKQLVSLINQAREAGARLIFVQPQFSTGSAAAIAEAIGGAVVPLDPLAGDYLENLTEMAAKIEQALGKPASGAEQARADGESNGSSPPAPQCKRRMNHPARAAGGIHPPLTQSLVLCQRRL